MVVLVSNLFAHHFTTSCSRPGSSGYFSLVLSWGDAVFATVLINTQDKYTLPIHIGFFLWGGEIVDPGRLAATALVAGLIPAFLYIGIQRFVRMGLVAGAVKG